MEFQYPAPGHSTVKMYYKYDGSHFGTMVDTNRYAKMYAFMKGKGLAGVHIGGMNIKYEQVEFVYPVSKAFHNLVFEP
jgi:hypothetical protein